MFSRGKLILLILELCAALACAAGLLLNVIWRGPALTGLLLTGVAVIILADFKRRFTATDS